MDKEIEKRILEYLKKSDSFWTDLYPFIKTSEYSYLQFYDILSELIKTDVITIKDKDSLSHLKLMVKGKLRNKSGLLFRITDTGHLRLRNDLYRLEENSTNKTTARINAKGQTSILQNVYWVIGIIVFFTVIHVFIEKQFELNIIKWITNKIK